MKCQSCGRENIRGRSVDFEGSTLFVCPLCYVQIEKNQIQTAVASRTLTMQSTNEKTLQDIIGAIDRIHETMLKHMDLNSEVDSQFDEEFEMLFSDVEKMSEELKGLKARIELLEGKKSDEKKE